MMLQEILYKVCDLAVKVGKFQAEQRKTFSRDCVESKHSHDYVSYVDKESEQMIVPELRELLPEAGFITEEKTTEQQTESAEYVWIVDPLDGTTNFIHDLGPWCVCIALKGKGELLLGVVYEVARDELFYAVKGGGAWMRASDGELKPLRVSPVSGIDQALIVMGYPYNADGFRGFSASMCSRFYGRCASLRSFGSAEAELCYVAAGRVETYIEAFVQPWDVSAGAVILREAGGRISDYAGTDELWPSGLQVLATNGALHETILAEIRNCTASIVM